MLRAIFVLCCVVAVGLLPACSSMEKTYGSMTAATELSSQLAKQFGVSEAQASAGVGSMLELAQSKLKAGDFDQVAKAIPGSQKYLDAAKKALGGTSVTDSAGLRAAFGKLGMSPDMVDKFKPVLIEFGGKLGGDNVKNLLASALK